VIRFATIKRNPERLLTGGTALQAHIDRFLSAQAAFRDWRVERGAIAPAIDPALRALLQDQGAIPQDLNDLVAGL
jgi:hypothetical protein